MDRRGGAVQIGSQQLLVPEERTAPALEQQTFDLRNWHETPNTHQHDYGIVSTDTEGYKQRHKEPADSKVKGEPELLPFEKMLLELENESRQGAAEPGQTVVFEPAPEGLVQKYQPPPSKGYVPPPFMKHAFTMRLVRHRLGEQETGVGVTIAASNFSRSIFIYAVAAEGPAAKSCLVHVGDALIAVDDVACEGLSGPEVAKLISGEPGTWVELTLVPAIKLVQVDQELSPFREESESRCLAVCPQPTGAGSEVRRLGVLVEKRLPVRHHQVIYIDPKGPVGMSRRVRVGDCVLKVDGESTEGMTSAQVNALLSEDTDRPLLLTLADKTLPVPPEAPPDNDESGRYVMTLDPNDPDAGPRIGLSVGVAAGWKDVVVLHVLENSAAAKTGKLREGDLLLKVDGVDVSSMGEEALPKLLQTNWNAKIPIELYMQEKIVEDANPQVELVVFRAAGGGHWEGDMRKGGLGATMERVRLKDGELVRIRDMDAEGPLGKCGSKLKAGAVLEAVDGESIAGQDDAQIAELISGDVGSPVLLTLKDHKDYAAPPPLRAPAGQTRWRVPAARLAGRKAGLGFTFGYSPLLLCYQVQAIDKHGVVGAMRRVKLGDLLLSIDGLGLGYKTKQEVERLLEGPVGSLVILTMGRIESMEDEKKKGEEEEEEDDNTWIEDEVGWGDPIGGLFKAVQKTLSKSSKTRDDWTTSAPLSA